MAYLYGIFTLPKHKRVRCMHEGCSKTVYARVHVVSIENEFILLGSTCYKTMFNKPVKRSVRVHQMVYGGMTLTDEQAQQIVTNTAEFMSQFKIDNFKTPEAIRKPYPIDDHVCYEYAVYIQERLHRATGHDPNSPSDIRNFTMNVRNYFNRVRTEPRLIRKANEYARQCMKAPTA